MEADLQEEQVEAPAVEEAEAPAKGLAGTGRGMTPEAKAAAQKLIAVAMRIVYKKEVSKVLLDTIRKAPKPEVGIAQAVLIVLKQIKDSAKGVPEKVIDSMARPVTMMILEMAAKAGLIEEGPELAQKVTALIQKAIGMARSQGNAPQPGQSGQMAPAPNAGAMNPNMGSQGMIADQMMGA